MYGGNIQTNTYSKLIKTKEPEAPVLSSLIERCPNEVDWGDRNKAQASWVDRCKLAVDSVAELNPYLPVVAAGDEVPALEAVAWVNSLGPSLLGNLEYLVCPKIKEN